MKTPQAADSSVASDGFLSGGRCTLYMGNILTGHKKPILLLHRGLMLDFDLLKSGTSAWPRQSAPIDTIGVSEHQYSRSDRTSNLRTTLIF